MNIHDSTTVTTEAQDVVVTYTYTPAVTKTYKTGGIKIIDPLELKFETIGGDGKAVVYNFYKCFPTGAFGHGFSPENSSEPIAMPVQFTAKKDTTRATGDQLFSITRNY